MQVTQYSNDGSVPFFVFANSGNYPGDGSAMPTVKLSKADGTQAQAQGEIVNDGGGVYRLLGNAADRNVLGVVTMIITASTGDVSPPVYYEVVAPSIWRQLLSLPQNIASMANNIRLLTASQVPASQKGEIQ